MMKQEIVPWRKSRSILYWRLRRLLLQDRIKRKMTEMIPSLDDGQAEAMIRRWFIEEKGTAEVSYFLFFSYVSYFNYY